MTYNWFAADLVPFVVTYLISFIVLLIGSITDLKTREVPDWLNYGLVISGISLNLLFSFIYSNPSFIINSVIGLVIFLGIAYLMFYAGQWGGGDSKMLMGLGAMIGVDLSFKTNQFLAGFFINVLFVGAIYGLFWSTFLAFRNKQKFLNEFRKGISKSNVIAIKKIMLICIILLFILLFFIKANYIKILVLSIAFLVLITFYLWIFVKAIEKSAMYKLVEPSKLTEGDWIVNDIVLKKKILIKKSLKDLGNQNIIKIKEFVSNFDKFVRVKRKIFGLFSYRKNINLSSMKLGDIILDKLKISNIILKRNKKIPEKIYYYLDNYFRQKTFLDVKVKRKFLWFNYTIKVTPKYLRNSDILLENLVYGYYTCGPKDLGIEKKQIKELIEFYNKGKIKKILIKEGIPFVPSFLIAFIVTLVFGNPLVRLL